MRGDARPSVNVIGAIRPPSVSSLTVYMFFKVSACRRGVDKGGIGLGEELQGAPHAGGGRIVDPVVGDAAGGQRVAVLLHRRVVDPPREGVQSRRRG